MNIFLWVLQILLALHTAMGAVWKFTNPEQNVPSLSAIPHGVWLGLSVVEIFVSVALVGGGFSKPLAFVVPVAALAVAAEMLLFCGVHVASGATQHNQMIYWLVVACICAFLAYGRFVLSPL